MALFDAPSHNISGDEDDATMPQKATTPLSDPDLVGRVLDYGDDAALSKAATVAKPFARGRRPTRRSTASSASCRPV